MKKTSLATGVSVTSVYKIKTEASASGFTTPGTSRPNRKPTKVFDDFEACVVRRLIHDMYLRGTRVTTKAAKCSC